MASPSEAQLEAILAAAGNVSNALLLAQTLQTQYDALVTAVGAGGADNGDEILAAARTGVLSIDESMADFSETLLQAWEAYRNHLAGGTRTGVEGLFEDLYAYLDGASGSIESRVFTNGAVSAGGGNTGDGTVRRVLVDPKGHAIQNRHAQVVTFLCDQDANIGTLRNAARYRVSGTKVDPLGTFLPYKAASTKGGGGGEPMSSVHASSEGNLIRNGSFDFVQVAAGQPTTGADALLAVGDSVDDWTIATGAATDLTSSVDGVYREEPGVSASKLLEFEDNVKLTQAWDALGIRATAGVAYWCQASLNRQASCDGAVSFRVGALTFTLADITSISNSTWTLLVPTANENLYGENLSETGATNEVEMTGRTTGTLQIDTFLAVPMQEFDAIPYSPVSGATDTLVADVYTFTDTLSAEGKLGLLNFLFFGTHLPHNATPTIPDP